MRHAKSSWDNPGIVDHDRPLNKRGRLAASRMANQLSEHNLLPDMVLASTATRVRETLQLMSDQWQHAVSVLFEKSLYLASPEIILAHVGNLPAACQRAMIVGHNPGLSELAGALRKSYIDLPTAGVIVFETEKNNWLDAVSAKTWREKAVWLPRELAD